MQMFLQDPSGQMSADSSISWRPTMARQRWLYFSGRSSFSGWIEPNPFMVGARLGMPINLLHIELLSDKKQVLAGDAESPGSTLETL